METQTPTCRECHTPIYGRYELAQGLCQRCWDRCWKWRDAEKLRDEMTHTASAGRKMRQEAHP